MTIHITDEERKKPQALVEATHLEYIYLWEKHRDEWEEDTRGNMLTIGYTDNRPVCIHLRWAKVRGNIICFWEPTSLFVDYQMIQKHFDEWFGYSPHRVDAFNFHNAFHEIATCLDS